MPPADGAPRPEPGLEGGTGDASRPGQHQDQAPLIDAAMRNKKPAGLASVQSFNANGTMPLHKPLKHHWNISAIIFLLMVLASSGFYFYLRIEKLLYGEYSVLWYSILVLSVEFLGLTSLVPYALLITRAWLPDKGQNGAPLPTKPRLDQQVYPFHVRVCVPCYKEPMSVIEKTVNAALNADLPIGTKRTVYLCDDGNMDEKRLFAEDLQRKGKNIVYVRDRPKPLDGETNGKSCNLNHCLQKVMFPECTEHGDHTWDYSVIGDHEILVVFDADMVCRKNFFIDILAVMTDPQTALCLSPQAFDNIIQERDIFNNINLQFWEYWLPGAAAWGYIACTGTNFAIRIKPLAHVGWFPTYTITEDYALGYELKKRNYKGAYLLKYLAVGEAPDEIRNVFRQRSRWTKGHMQVFFSWKACPLLQWNLPFDQKLWYSYGTWTYFCTIFTVPTFIIVPFVSLALGVHPTTVDMRLAIVATAYFVASFLVQGYVRDIKHWTSLWFMAISNVVLWFTYFKAVFNTLLSIIGLKQKSGFKVTVKKEDPNAPKPPPTVMGSFMQAMSSRLSMRRRKPATPEELQGLTVGEQSAAVVPPRPAKVEQLPVMMQQQPYIPQPEAPKKKPSVASRIANVFLPQNMGDMDGTLDALALVLLFFFCISTIAMGIYRVVMLSRSGADGSAAFMSFWVALPVLWACLNGIAPYLFIHYCFSGGRSFQTAATLTRILSRLLTVAALGLVFFTLPKWYDVQGALNMSVDFISKNRASSLNINDDTATLNGAGDGIVLPLAKTGWFLSGSGNRPLMPSAYATTFLAWGLYSFPNGYGAKSQDVYDNVKAGADFIYNSYMDGKLVVQVGNPRRYSTAGDPLSDADKFRKWTNIQADISDPGRVAYYITAEDNAGDAVGSAAAALAAAAAVARKRGDKEAASNYVERAKKIFELASGDQALKKEKSFCLSSRMILNSKQKAAEEVKEFSVPETVCSFHIEVPTATLVQEVKDKVKPADEIKCWVADFSSKTCTPRDSHVACKAARKFMNVYKRRGECCAEMNEAGMYKNQTTAQGACALPEGQLECYMPNRAARTCTEHSIDVTKGTGCTGVGIPVWSSPQECCHNLQTLGVINDDQPGNGVCMQEFDQLLEMKKCFVINKKDATCQELKGKDCNKYGLGITFPDELRCCNKLVTEMGGNRALAGVCKGAGTTEKVKDAEVDANGKEGAQAGKEGAQAGKEGADAMENINLLNVLNDDLNGRRRSLLSVVLDAARSEVRRGLQQAGASSGDLTALITSRMSRGKASRGSSSTRAAANAGKPDAEGAEGAADAAAAKEEDFITEIIDKDMPVSNFESNSFLDDMSLAAAWLFRATDDPMWLGKARYYMHQHQLREMNRGLAATRAYYVPNYDNAVWAAAVILAEDTDHVMYHDMVRTFLRAWLGFKAPEVSSRQEELALIVRQQRVANAERLLTKKREEIQTLASGKMVRVVEAECAPERNETATTGTKTTNSTYLLPYEEGNAKTWEDICDDGIDNDCDGLTDDEDPNCPWAPIKYTDKALSWSDEEPLPAVAAAAFISMVYARSASQELGWSRKSNMQCWALGQMHYVLGSSGRSFVVGYGTKPPSQVQHTESSCPVDPASKTIKEGCSWDNAFYAGTKNPNADLVAGALVAGPDLRDRYSDDRASDMARVGVHYNAPFSAALAALLEEGMNSRTCGSMRGVYQDIFKKQDL